MSFIVIEGLDGAGKSTQIDLLKDHLESHKVLYKYLHFPRTESPFYGNMIARFLRGEFGDLNSVDPYFVALIYAGDRTDASVTIRSWLEDGYLVVADRYVQSNIAFQCAKTGDRREREELRKWILSFEFEYNRIPEPDLSIFLDVPFRFTESKLSLNRAGDDRTYLNGKQDIHEKNLSFQEKVRDVYLSEVKRNPDFQVVNCSTDDASILPQVQIFQKILELLRAKKILT